MARFANAVQFNPTLGGTTDWVVSSAVQGFMTPALAGAPTGVYKYRAESADLTQWELGEGTYTSGTTTLTRTTVLYNSAGTGTGAGQSGAGTKINFTLPPYVAIVQAVEDTLALDNANVFTSAQRAQARQNVSAPLRGHIAGLTLSTAGSSLTFGISVGECASSDGTDLLRLASAYTKTTSAWAVGTGNGALDTSTIAVNTWYHVYLIKHPTTLVVDVLVSLSATAPTLPAGYTLSRRIGAMRTNASSQWLAFTQIGEDFFWAALQTDITGTSGTTSVTQTLTYVPTGVAVLAFFTATAFASSVASSTRVRSLTEADAAVGFASANLYDPSAGSGVTSEMQIMTNTSAQFATRSSVALAGSGGFAARTKGWRDTRGRFD